MNTILYQRPLEEYYARSVRCLDLKRRTVVHGKFRPAVSIRAVRETRLWGLPRAAESRLSWRESLDRSGSSYDSQLRSWRPRWYSAIFCSD